jgi:hypothetical protein
MRRMTHRAFAVLDGRVNRFGDLNLGLKIIVALVTRVATFVFEQLLVFGGVRTVANSAIARFNRCMHEFGCLGKIVVTLVTNIFASELRQKFVRAAVRQMAFKATVQFQGCVLDRTFENGLVTLQTKVVSGFQQQLFIWRFMRIVTAGALAQLDRLVHDRHGCGKILLVTLEAEFLLRQFQDRVLSRCAVTLMTIVVREGRMQS